jgi:hypothetical protein
MDEDVKDPWSDALGQWVWLDKLLATVEQELSQPVPAAAKVLRPAMEVLRIRTDVPKWPHSSGIADNTWVFSNGEWTGVSDAGWEHVDWKTGTLAGRHVRVLWSDVQRELLRSTATGQVPQTTGPAGTTASNKSRKTRYSLNPARAKAIADNMKKDGSPGLSRGQLFRLIQDKENCDRPGAQLVYDQLPKEWKNEIGRPRKRQP